MAVPDFQSFFKPLLDLAADGKEHSIQEAREVIAKVMALPEADLKNLFQAGFRRSLKIELPGLRAILFKRKSWSPDGVVCFALLNVAWTFTR